MASPEVVTVGRSVHYVMAGGGELGSSRGQHRSAVVVETGIGGIEDVCDLTVYLQRRDSSEFIQRQHHVPFDQEGKRPHSWHWPERDTGLRRSDPPAPDSESIGNR